MGSLIESRYGVVLAGLVLAISAVAVSPQAGAAQSQVHLSSHVSIAASQTPAFAGDAGDPDVVYSDGTYYAFTTGTPLGNHIQALVNTTGNPSSGWRSYTGLLRIDGPSEPPGLGGARTRRPRRASSTTAVTGSCGMTPRRLPTHRLRASCLSVATAAA